MRETRKLNIASGERSTRKQISSSQSGAPLNQSIDALICCDMAAVSECNGARRAARL